MEERGVTRYGGAPQPAMRSAAGAHALAGALLLLACRAQPDTLIYDGETDEEMLQRARETARSQGYDPADVVEMGAPFPGEWDDAQDEKRCSGCIGSMLELHRALSRAASKRWHLQRVAGENTATRLREIPLLEAIDVACTEGVEGYGFGQAEDAQGIKRAGYYAKRQQIVRTMDDKIGKAMSEMCYRLAEDGDRSNMLAEAHNSDSRALAWESCVLLNQGEPKSVYFGGQMCTQDEALRWFTILMPKQPPAPPSTEPDSAVDDEGFAFEEYKAKFGYRLEQSEARGGQNAAQLWEEADADGNGLLSRAEIAAPAVRAILAPKTVDEHLFVKKFGKLQFKDGESAASVFFLLDEDQDELLDLEEMRGLKAYITMANLPREL
jgi:hypothetical protein